MELQETIKKMESSDYKERFCAEYEQLVIRQRKLANMLEKWDTGSLPFAPSCPRSVYELQLKAMNDYKSILEARAAIENINI